MNEDFDTEEIFKDAIIKGRIRLTRTNDHCIFCDAKQDCISWVPDRMNQVLPICEKCFSAVSGIFKKISGGFIWG
ncbi:MAG: hypothetical protein NTV58_06330 [Deltaproteobacteria bacterium]|nr:hypothetical protein [Deltaproteobacteria bacterium]